MARVVSRADVMSGKLVQFESFLEQRSPCDHLTVGRLKADMETLSQKVSSFVMQNLKIVDLLPRRIESLERRMREVEGKLIEDRKIKDLVC